MKTIITLMLGAVLFVTAACGGAAETPTPAPTNTSVPIATLAPTATVAPTPVAPTPTVATPAAVAFTVAMNDLYFGDTNDNMNNPPVWSVTSDAEVTVTVANRSGGLQHNWAISKLDAVIPQPFVGGEGLDIVLLDSGVVDAGQSTTITFTAPAVGEYLVICTVPGHYPVMQGKLVVASP
ncbi:MAG: plastocyanin/azurin family copper-binding protein [Caldilineaceae bacterium]|jgi:uncharacterized cupredoxin-like copper-binding protein